MKSGQFRIYRSRLAGVEAVRAETGHSFPKHTHDQFGIGIIEAGAQRSLSGRGMVQAEAGDVISVNPNEVHDGMPIGRSRAWSMLYFDPRLIGDLLRDVGEGGFGAVEFPSPVIRDGEMAGHFKTLFSLLIEDAAENILLRDELLLSLIADVMRERAGAVREDAIPADIKRARELIDDDPAASLTLAELAELCGLSHFRFLRAFAKATGLTPHAYLMQRRIHEARRLIAVGTPLAEAAFASGFSDQSHMTRLFVRNFGVSPGAYAAAIG
ncbi:MULTISPECIES: AraC family transcriptional regulator [Rhizobium]|uniref:AraC family transcriptional regulator n=1 Tax=Rhizobium tropici TaxID=398 RepID=A0A6P1C0D5_RHITR|nr:MULTISPECIES: AraC family transcriptional regulator [Rhizobium]AGB71854.1 transcriptional regulator, AraC family [Rhizobium tropici CIAT 899]MBB4243751.1 AraC-like DNA-binding protein [Rhizobium tropici]MBB5593274.1 AraC-like DNA-binding protein [Rhizobium tropici]MBB6494091.1 AraC-like DNA-binding protein [Rhizobium tropici]NEV09786.1 AraC family transcriptional regulator [Rhizobium tropici]